MVAVKLVLIFACVIAFGAGAMYFFGNVLPEMLPPAPAQSGPSGVGRHPGAYMPPEYAKHQRSKDKPATPLPQQTVFDESGASAGIEESSFGGATTDRTEL